MGRPMLPYNRQYHEQKGNARRRGIEFNFTYQEWLDWWGDDIEQRGKGFNKLVMARKNDQGAYHPDNVVKMLNQENVRDGNLNKVITDEYREKLSIASYKRWGTYKEEQVI